MLRIGEHAVAERRDRLVREARTAASLSHPNICTVFEVGESDGHAFIAMELVEGRTLAELIREQPIEPRIAIDAAIQCAAALTHAHERGVLHRDLKAGNIVLTPDGSVKVLDFGLARHLDHHGIEIPSRGTAALPTNLRGTLAYMAPELLRGELADVRSDIWSLGVTVFEMLTGELPFSGHSDFELASAILSGPARKLPPHIHPRIGEIVRCCLSGDASLRFQSATELHHALVSYQRQADDGPTKRISWLHQLRSGRSPGWSRLTVLCTLLVCLSALFGWQQLRPTARTAAGCDAITLISQAHVAVLPTQLIGTATSEPHLGIVIPDMITTRLAASERHGPASIGPPRLAPPS